MRYIIYGAGGIGSVIGGFLFQEGCDVILVGRPAHVTAISKNGLSLISSRGRCNLKIPAVEKAEDLKPFRDDDMVLLTAKSQHTMQCLAELKAAGAPIDLPICCMQNSIGNEAQAIRIFDKIYAAMIIVPAFYLTPGEAIHYFSGDSGYIDIGCYPSGVDERCKILVKDLNKAGFVSRTRERVMRSKAGKCLGNLVNAYSVIKGTEEQKQNYMERVRDEAAQIWISAGIEFETREEFQRRTGAAATWERWEAPEQKGMNWGGSGWQTLERKAGSSEAPQLNGDVVRIGKELGIGAPANRALCEITTSAAIEGRGPESISFEVLEKLYRKYDKGS